MTFVDSSICDCRLFISLMEKSITLNHSSTNGVLLTLCCDRSLQWSSACCSTPAPCQVPAGVKPKKRSIKIITYCRCEKKIISRGWFRSIDLWVMGPARSHCATLLSYTKPALSMQCTMHDIVLFNTKTQLHRHTWSPKTEWLKRLYSSRAMTFLFRLKVL